MKKQVCFLLCLAPSLCFAPLLSLAQTLKDPLAKALVGEWRNTYVRLQIVNEKETLMEADSSNWEERLHIKPICTHFLPDGTYYSEYRNLQDSIVRRPSGTWTIVGDTLTMSQSKPESSEIRVHLQIEKNVATFIGLIDFDGDGKRNDRYYGRQRKYE